MGEKEKERRSERERTNLESEKQREKNEKNSETEKKNKTKKERTSSDHLRRQPELLSDTCLAKGLLRTGSSDDQDPEARATTVPAHF